LNAEEPDILTALNMLGLNILWHPSLSIEKGNDVLRIFNEIADGKERLDILIVEGAIPTSPDGSGMVYEFLDKPFLEWIRKLASMAEYTVAVGTCAANGGISGAYGNPTGASGMQFRRDKAGGILGSAYRSLSGFPVINIPGCPAHPDWILETV
jgi:Ni,Fe-hydrogenase I small subunit